jgi:hypothetical protein
VVDLRPALWRLRVSLESADDPLFTVGQDRVLEVRRKRVETGAAVEHVAPSDTRGSRSILACGRVGFWRSCWRRGVGGFRAGCSRSLGA